MGNRTRAAFITNEEIQKKYPKIKSFSEKSNKAFIEVHTNGKVNYTPKIKKTEELSEGRPPEITEEGVIRIFLTSPIINKSTENTEVIVFRTLSHLGIRNEGEYQPYFSTQEAAEDSYLKYLFEFLDKEVTEDCELVWRIFPENICDTFHDCEQIDGKIHFKNSIYAHSVYSRLLIRKLTNNK